MNDEFYGKKKVRAISGLAETTIWRLEKAGKFPRRRQLSPGRVAWIRSEVEAWIASRAPAGDSAGGRDV